MNILSPGEMTVGQFVMVYSWEERVSYTDNVTGKPVDEYRENPNPQIQGIPLEVVMVNGPIIGVRVSFVQRGTWMVPILFFDTRRVKFLESTREFFELYRHEMGQHYRRPIAPKGARKVKVNSYSE